MSIKLMKAVWDSRESLGLNGIETAILVKLADFAQDDGSSIYPSLEHLARKTGFSKSTTQRSLKLLCAQNLLINVAGRKTQTNLYRIDAQKVYSSASHVVEAMVTATTPMVTLTTPEEKTTSDTMVTLTIPIVTVTTPMVTLTTSYSHSDHQSIIEPLIEPLSLLPVSSKRPVADAPRNCALQNAVLEGIQNTPPGGCVEESSAQLQNPELLKGNSLQGLGVGYSYGVSFVKPSLEGGFSSVLNKPSKTCLISRSKGQSLVSIGNYQKTSPDTLKGPLIDMSGLKEGSELSSLSSPGKKAKTKASLDEDGFKKWYDLYPRKVSRKKALQAFGKAIKIVDLETLLDLTRSYAQSVEDKDKTFVPHPSSWLNGERWEDMRSESLSQNSSATLSQSPQRPVMHPRLQAFVTAHHQLGSNAFAFQSCEVLEHADKIILQVPSRHCLDKVDLYHRELEDHFDKEVEMVIKAPQPQVVEEKPVVTLSEIDFLEPRFKEFLQKNIQIDAGVHFAFKATTITETADTILLHNDLAYGLSKVDFYARDLEQFFGKRVEVPSKTPPRSPHPQPLPTVDIPKAENETTRKHSPNNNGHVTPRAVLKESLKDLRTTPGVNTFPYKSIGVVLQEARQGLSRQGVGR